MTDEKFDIDLARLRNDYGVSKKSNGHRYGRNFQHGFHRRFRDKKTTLVYSPLPGVKKTLPISSSPRYAIHEFFGGKPNIEGPRSTGKAEREAFERAMSPMMFIPSSRNGVGPRRDRASNFVRSDGKKPIGSFWSFPVEKSPRFDLEKTKFASDRAATGGGGPGEREYSFSVGTRETGKDLADVSDGPAIAGKSPSEERSKSFAVSGTPASYDRSREQVHGASMSGFPIKPVYKCVLRSSYRRHDGRLWGGRPEESEWSICGKRYYDWEAFTRHIEKKHSREHRVFDRDDYDRENYDREDHRYHRRQHHRSHYEDDDEATILSKPDLPEPIFIEEDRPRPFSEIVTAKTTRKGDDAVRDEIFSRCEPVDRKPGFVRLNLDFIKTREPPWILIRMPSGVFDENEDGEDDRDIEANIEDNCSS
jgi:hypothetical protein